MRTYEALPNTQVFGNAQPFAGRRTNGELGGREAEKGTSSPFRAIVRDTRVFEVIRRRGTRVRASPSLRDLGPAYSLRLRSRAEHGWLARYLRRRKQAEKSITRTGVTTPRGRGQAARDSCPWVSTCCRNRWEVAARRSDSFIPLRRHARAWARATRSAGNSGMHRSQGRDIVEAAPSKTATEKRATAHSRHGIVQTLESSSANRRKASSVVRSCVFFTERSKKRPWLDGPHRTPLETVGRKSREREGCQKLDRTWTKQGENPSSKTR